MHNRLAAAGAIVFAGFTVSSYIGSVPSFVVSAVFAAAAATALLKKRRNAVFISVAAFAAFFIFAVYSHLFIAPVSRLYGGTYDIYAKVLSVGNSGNDAAYITASGTADGIPVKFSLYSPDIGVKSGDTVEMTVKFTEPAASASFSENYNYSRGVFVRAAAKSLYVTEKGSADGFAEAVAGYSEHLRDKIKENLSGDSCGLFLAMCFGDRKSLSAEMSDAVLRSGLSHMTAVSGMHISLMVTAIVSVICALSSGRSRVAVFISAAVFSVIFMVFFNFSASVCRSGVMLIIYYGSQMFGRRTSSLNSLGAAMLVLLLAEPNACRDTGLVLSACGTFGAGFLAPRVFAHIKRRFPRVPDRTEAVIACICASYCTLPVSAAAFGVISLAAVFSSIAVYPLFVAAMCLAVAFALTGGVFPALLLPAGALSQAMSAVIRFMAGARYSCVALDTDMIIPFAAVSSVFAAASFLISRRSANRHYILAAAAVLCLCATAGIVTAHKVSRSGITEISVFSDGSEFLVAVNDSSGISAFMSDVGGKLSSAAYDALSSHGRQSFDLLCAITDSKRSDIHSDTLEGLPAREKRYPGNCENAYDISGIYTVEVYEDSVCMEISGVSIVLCDISAAPVYGAQDIGIYSGYKKSAVPPANGITVLCDKRYADADQAYSAYSSEITILINSAGECLVTER